MGDSVAGFAERNAEFRYRHLRLMAALGGVTGLLCAPVFFALQFNALGWGCLSFAAYCLVARWLVVRYRQMVGPLANLGIFVLLLLTSSGALFQSIDIVLVQWVMTVPVAVFILCTRRLAIFWVAVLMLLQVGLHVVRPEILSWQSTLMVCMALLASAVGQYAFAKYLEANERLIVTLGNTDSLTNTLNRRSFPAMLESEVNRNRQQRSTLAVFMVDVDFFKQYNDRYGHVSGDGILVSVAQALKHAAQRAGAHVFRYGGEEFCLLSSGLEQSQAVAFAERLRADVAALGLAHSGSPFGMVTISVGCRHTDGYNAVVPQRLVEEADKALYLAKLNGRNRVEYCEGPALLQIAAA